MTKFVAGKMRVLIPFLFLLTIHGVISKNNVKALTESMGQEVIEIGAPIKELPPDLDEEPSIESDDEDKYTTTTIQAGTKKDVKKPSTTTGAVDNRRKNKDIEKNTLSEKEKADAEEARIEKELAEIYKDNTDYKGDSSEAVKEVTPEQKFEDKPIGRSRTNFKFQPDINSKSEIEKFRTSIDDISCGRVTKLSGVTAKPAQEGNSASRSDVNFIISTTPLVFAAIFK